MERRSLNASWAPRGGEDPEQEGGRRRKRNQPHWEGEVDPDTQPQEIEGKGAISSRGPSRDDQQ